MKALWVTGGFVLAIALLVVCDHADPTAPDRERLVLAEECECEDPAPPPGSCTRVIGFSQTNQWFDEFEAEPGIEGAAWELLWYGGGVVERWADPSYEGWSSPVVSACLAGPPDRVVLNVGTFLSDTLAWADAIRAAIATTKAKVPSADTIVLQSIVGDHFDPSCKYRRRYTIVASWQHRRIDSAIAGVLADGDPMLSLGPSPEVASCSQYADRLGHLTASGEDHAGREIGEWYLP